MNDKDFAKQLIDKILDKSSELNVAWHWGEESILISDIIQLINDEANIDYKRYSAYASAYNSKDACKEIDDHCYLCKNHWTRFDKKEYRQHCIGSGNFCESYKGVFDD